jgi:hypothetical protein
MARFICAALCVVAFACVWSFPVRANEIQVGSGLVCDTKEQVAMFASLFPEKGAQGAIDAIAEDAKTPNACVIGYTVAYVVVEKMDEVKIAGNAYYIGKVLIVGVRTGQGMQPVQPQEFYTLFPAEGRPA